ncbi:MAG: hypothetical protein P1U58_00810 [Verrucomicrobiales bacterium]|nr:hypothetical protein [Verrucomicrobiales bacterium]
MLCLDAPLVAAAWALVVSSLREGPLDSPYPVVALFSAVWAVYLFDRLYDTRRLAIEKHMPMRHKFTVRFRSLILTLLVIALSLALLSYPFLPVIMKQGGAILAGLTLGYYVVFRFFRRFSGQFLRGPWKELTIALCFTSGIFLSVFPIEASAEALLLGVAMTSLFFANCFRISMAEADYDKFHDPAGFFAFSCRRSSRTVVVLPTLAFVISLYLILSGEVIPIGFCILGTSLICFVINSTRRISDSFVQAFADLALLIFPLTVLALQFILTR